MKFDFCIGNPPYQDNTLGDNDTYAPPVYNKFMDAAYDVADKVELIHPARFLFNAGSTPKAWNKKMLQDEHFKIIQYEEDCSKIFSNTDIKGGIAISYRDGTRDFGAIDVFTPFEQMNQILKKVKNDKKFTPISTIIISSYAYHFTEELYKDYPECKGKLSDGHDYDLKSNVFYKMPEPFFEKKPSDREKYLKILGRENNERTYRYIKAKYLRDDVKNLHYYKAFMPGATGTGEFGQVVTPPIVGEPDTGATETFLSIGTLDSEIEAENVIKYVKTKFARAMYGILKKTQANTPEKWLFVPIQDFSPQSDIDWNKSIQQIDQQLYKKYGLTKKEISFIETHVKEMV